MYSKTRYWRKQRGQNRSTVLTKKKKKKHQDLLEGETGFTDDAKKNQKRKVILLHLKDITAYQVTY